MAFSRLQVTLSLVTVTIAHLVYVFPFFFLIARAALERLDPALEETASDLGANRWTVFRRVTIPQIWPILVGAACLAFALSFDEFVITFFVIGPDSTLPLFIWSSLKPHHRSEHQRDLVAAPAVHDAAFHDHLRAHRVERAPPSRAWPGRGPAGSGAGAATKGVA